MAGFGENLRREREMRGITLDEISNTTKISIRLLESLESEDFSKLPGGIFTRSFIRAYANYLGLDEEHVMSEFEITAPAHGEEDLSRFGASSKSQDKSRPPILPWAIAILMLAGGYGIFHYGHRSTEAPVSFGNPSPSAGGAPAAATAQSPLPGPPPQVLAPDTANELSSSPNTVSSGTSDKTANAKNGASSTSTLIKADKNTADQTGTVAAATKPITSGSAPGSIPGASLSSSAASPPSSQSSALSSASSAAAEAAGNLVLQVAATQRIWVAVDADGKTVLERVLDPAEQRTLMAKNYFDVTTGNAQGTVLTLNGVTLKPLGRSGEVKTLHLTRDDLRNPTH